MEKKILIILAAVVLVVVIALGIFVVPSIIGGPTPTPVIRTGIIIGYPTPTEGVVNATPSANATVSPNATVSASATPIAAVSAGTGVLLRDFLIAGEVFSFDYAQVEMFAAPGLVHGDRTLKFIVKSDGLKIRTEGTHGALFGVGDVQFDEMGLSPAGQWAKELPANKNETYWVETSDGKFAKVRITAVDLSTIPNRIRFNWQYDPTGQKFGNGTFVAPVPTPGVSTPIVIGNDIMDTARISGFRFSSGQLENDTPYQDLYIVPWTDIPGMCGNWVDMGAVDLNSVTEAPISGYLKELGKDCERIYQQHVYVVKTKSNRFGKIKITDIGSAVTGSNFWRWRIFFDWAYQPDGTDRIG